MKMTMELEIKAGKTYLKFNFYIYNNI